MPLPLMLAGLLGSPAVLIGLVGALGLGAFWVQDYFEDRGFRNEITKLEEKFDAQLRANSQLQFASDKAEENVAKLTQEITDMNARLDDLARQRQQMESAANLRVARALRAGEAAAAALRVETTRVPPGHEAMNKWLMGRFGL